jgi:CxxC motif-containing protein (DUF1111 family)
MRSLKVYVLSLALFAAALPFLLPTNVESQTTATEAPTGFDNQTNGCVDQVTHDADRAVFENVEGTADGLGPTFNGTSCAGCHSTPVSGGVSAVTELRAGHLSIITGDFVPATAFVNFGTEPIRNRSLINLNAICPAAQETLTAADNIRALRLTVNVLGDGYVEAISATTLTSIRMNQPLAMKGDIVLIDENGRRNLSGRFGWKDQHAGLLAFSSDAYLNEMGISNRMSPNQDDVTHQCDTVPDPEDVDNDIDTFTRFIQATKAPPRDTALAATADAQAGSQLFDQIGCSTCHVSTIVTDPPGSVKDGPVPDCLANKIIHPFSDFLLHDIGTGDGIVQTGDQSTRNKLRTAPLWGLRTHTVFMHDGGSSTISDAIQRHSGQAGTVTTHFNNMSATKKQQLLTFLNSL